MLGPRPRGALPARGAVRPARRHPGAPGRRGGRRGRVRGPARDRGPARRTSSRRAGSTASLIDGVVLGVPGAVDEASRVHLAPRVPGLEGMQLGLELSERLGSPVTLENDINLAALGERWQGVASGVDDFVFLSVGTGLGAGLVLQGQLHRGAPRRGRRGRPRARRPEARARSVGGRHPDARRRALRSELRGRVAGCGRRSPRRTCSRAPGAGDPLGRAVVAEEARRIALHIVPIAAVVDVSLVVLGGGVGANGDLLLGAGPRRARTLAAVSAAGRDLQPRRDRRPERRPLRRAHRGPRQRLRRIGRGVRRIGAPHRAIVEAPAHDDARERRAPTSMNPRCS